MCVCVCAGYRGRWSVGERQLEPQHQNHDITCTQHSQCTPPPPHAALQIRHRSQATLHTSTSESPSDRIPLLPLLLEPHCRSVAPASSRSVSLGRVSTTCFDDVFRQVFDKENCLCRLHTRQQGTIVLEIATVCRPGRCHELIRPRPSPSSGSVLRVVPTVIVPPFLEKQSPLHSLDRDRPTGAPRGLA